MIVPILWSHSHQGMNKSDVVLRDDPVSVRSILTKGVRYAVEVLALDGLVVEPNYARYAAHRKTRLNGSRYSELGNARETVAAPVANNRVVADLDPGMTRQFFVFARYRKAKSAGDAAPAQHGGRGEGMRQATIMSR
jgi:hypothetical protein